MFQLRVLLDIVLLTCFLATSVFAVLGEAAPCDTVSSTRYFFSEESLMMLRMSESTQTSVSIVLHKRNITSHYQSQGSKHREFRFVVFV